MNTGKPMFFEGLGMKTWRASEVETVSVEPGVRKQDIPLLPKLDVVLAVFLSHFRGGPIQLMFPLKLLGCFWSWVTATLALKKTRVRICWTKVQCMWVFFPVRHLCAHSNWLLMMSTLLCFSWMAEIENSLQLFASLDRGWNGSSCVNTSWCSSGFSPHYPMEMHLLKQGIVWEEAQLDSSLRTFQHITGLNYSISVSTDLNFPLCKKDQLHHIKSWFCLMDN